DEFNENRNLVWNKRVKAHLILISSTNTNRESVAYRSFRPSEFEARGVRKVTTGITGLWQPSVHSGVAFGSFDVGSSYHCEAEFTKCWIVHPPIGNVSWVKKKKKLMAQQSKVSYYVEKVLHVHLQ